MFFDGAFHNRQSQTGAFHTGGDVGLGESCHMFGGESGAVIFQSDGDGVFGFVEGNGDGFFCTAFEGFGGVLQ